MNITNKSVETKATLRKRVLVVDRDGIRQSLYLLGADSDGTLMWLPAPIWTEGWHWVYDGVVTFFFNDPLKFGRKNSFRLESLFFRRQPTETSESEWKRVGNIYESPLLVYTTFTEDEGWKLSEWIRQLDIFTGVAEISKNGYAGVSSQGAFQHPSCVNSWHKIINRDIIPSISENIIKTLSPEI